MSDDICVHPRLFTGLAFELCRDCGMARDLPDGRWRSQKRWWPAWAIRVVWDGPEIKVCPDCDYPMERTYHPVQGQRRRCPLCGLVWRRTTKPPR